LPPPEAAADPSARLFVAVALAPAVRLSLTFALDPLRAVPGAPRWIPPDRWHLTLAFLGDVPESSISGLSEVCDDVAGRGEALRLSLRGAGTFPSRGDPRVFWIGLSGEVDRLTALAKAVARAMRRAGVAIEHRAYMPHLTVGRWRPRDPVDRGLAARLDGYESQAWVARDVHLIRSHLGPAPSYEGLHAARLEAG
jgi:2'-5' RNA ligase